MEENGEYYKIFYSIMINGICNGLHTPYESWVSYYRFCCNYASSIHEEGGKEMIDRLFKYSRNFFNDIYNNEMLHSLDSNLIHEEVIEWLKNLYKNSNNIFRDEFIGWMIAAYKYEGKEH